MPYASVNGLHLYYEIRGAGRPLVLLPGGIMSSCHSTTLRSPKPTCSDTACSKHEVLATIEKFAGGVEVTSMRCRLNDHVQHHRA
jgi:hypothetical protein